MKTFEIKVAFWTLIASIISIGVGLGTAYWVEQNDLSQIKNQKSEENKIWEAIWKNTDGITLSLGLNEGGIEVISMTDFDGEELEVKKVVPDGDKLVITVLVNSNDTAVEYYLSKPENGRMKGYWVNESMSADPHKDFVFTKYLRSGF